MKTSYLWYMRDYIRNCPQCDKILSYSSYKSLWRANKLNASCAECASKSSRKEKSEDWNRTCPTCKVLIMYTTRGGMKKAISKNTLCMSCTAKSYPGHPQTAEAKAKISMNHKRPWLGKTKPMSAETKLKMRVSTIKFIEKLSGKCVPRYNPTACQLFTQLNEHFGWNGLHAENGGEYHIKELGYFVDYFEPNVNLVIEYDEPAHDKKIKKDLERQRQIEELLECKFVRIKESDDVHCIRQKIKEVL